MMTVEAIEDVEEGARVGGELLKDEKFTDNQGMMAQSKSGLQTILDVFSKIIKKYGMKINDKKTKVMRICQDERILRFSTSLGHILRGESLVKEVIEGRMEGNKGREKSRIMMLDNIKANQTYEMIKRRAVDRESWKNWMSRSCFQTEHQS